MADLVVIGAGRAGCEAAPCGARMGLDIGDPLIGMPLRPVAVPYRGEIRQIGHANLVCAYSRVPYAGGERAVYTVQEWGTNRDLWR